MSIEVQIQKKLGDFSLDVAFSAGDEVLALLGASGCGKSMTLRCIAGVERPDSGRIVVDGETVYDSAARIDLPPRKRRVGLLFQNYALFPTMTVAQNVAAGLGRENRDKLGEYIRRFRLEGLEHLLPRQLSGGQQQRTALARMLAAQPRLLMLDEPFSALDSHLRWELEQEVMAVTASFGGTTLLVSHDRDEVYRAAGRIAVYGRGRVDCVGDKWDLYHHPPTATAARLTGCQNLAPARFDGCTAQVEEWGLTLTLPGEASGEWLGIRAQHLEGAREPGDNVFPYEVLSQTEDTAGITLTIRPVHAPQARPLRWELTLEEFQALPPGGLVRLPPERLLPLGP